jgi:hypothetical protein
MEDHDDIEATLYRSEASILRGPTGAAAQLISSSFAPLSSNQTIASAPPSLFRRSTTTTTATTKTSALYYRNGQQQQQQQQQNNWWRLQVAISLVVFWVGWRVPKSIMDRDDSLVHRPAPYQVTAAGDVLLDFALNEPLVDPPTISCTYPPPKKKCIL